MLKYLKYITQKLLDNFSTVFVKKNTTGFNWTQLLRNHPSEQISPESLRTLKYLHMKTRQLTIPMFPLNMVLFPGETTKLYIFEERYKQLVDDCLENDASFGIPYIEKGKVQKFGCEVKINRILKTYENGGMDILIEST